MALPESFAVCGCLLGDLPGLGRLVGFGALRSFGGLVRLRSLVVLGFLGEDLAIPGVHLHLFEGAVGGLDLDFPDDVAVLVA